MISLNNHQPIYIESCQMIAMMTNSDPTAAVASVAIKKAGE